MHTEGFPAGKVCAAYFILGGTDTTKKSTSQLTCTLHTCCIDMNGYGYPWDSELK